MMVGLVTPTQRSVLSTQTVVSITLTYEMSSYHDPTDAGSINVGVNLKPSVTQPLPAEAGRLKLQTGSL